MPFRIETNYREINAGLKRYDAQVAKDTKKALKAAVAPTVAEARGIAAGHGFQRVLGAIVPTITNRYAGVKVRARASAAGVLHERSRGHWRHPVFGNDQVWVSQTAKPSLGPAFRRQQKVVRAELTAILEAAKKEAGFR